MLSWHGSSMSMLPHQIRFFLLTALCIAHCFCKEKFWSDGSLFLLFVKKKSQKQLVSHVFPKLAMYNSCNFAGQFGTCVVLSMQLVAVCE